MYISEIKINNFRKLKTTKIELQKEKSVFVGANNSGKTTAMVAIKCFLNGQKFNFFDFSLLNQNSISSIGEKIEKETANKKEHNIEDWLDVLPFMDLWFYIPKEDVHRVGHIIPTLDWSYGDLGVRIRLEPRNTTDLYKGYYNEYENIKTLKDSAIQKINDNGSDNKEEKKKSVKDSNLFPKDFIEFLHEKLDSYFILRYYTLDPNKKNEDQKELGEALVSDEQLKGNPIEGLIKINEINPQRQVSEANNGYNDNKYEKDVLSRLISQYYKEHLDPRKSPTEKDMDALVSMYEAQKKFGEDSKTRYKDTLSDLKKVGYPGPYNPDIEINPKIQPTDGLNHDSVIQHSFEGSPKLPEAYTGLGFQSLILMTFKLISFRDGWIKKGKKAEDSDDSDNNYQPIHLVLIEEPEAHLHPQAQQVFVSKAYEILEDHEKIKKGNLQTQLIFTTHSSHVVNKCKFDEIRYFRRENTRQETTVINMSNVFGKDKDTDTERFVSRHIMLAHSDLFFADAAILIEGAAERILLPYFINIDEKRPLNSAYISILEVGGSHAHVLLPLLEQLQIPILFISDIDSQSEYVSENEDGKTKKSWKAAYVELGKSQITNNDTIKKLLFDEKETVFGIDKLISLTDEEKSKEKPFPYYVAYQIGIMVDSINRFPYTFEDSIYFENKALFEGFDKPRGMIAKFKGVENEESAFKVIRDKNFKKSDFALDLLYLEEFEDLKVPSYILKGLEWLEIKLEYKIKPEVFSENKEKSSDKK